MISAFGGSLWVFGQANLFILNTHSKSGDHFVFQIGNRGKPVF